MAKYPFDDEYMVYDYAMHRYVLTPKAVLDRLNEDLTKYSPADSANREKDVLVMLDNISSEVYNAIYESSADYLYPEFVGAKAPSARSIILQAMLEQVKYFMFNGTISVYSGVNFKKGTISEKANSRILAPNAERILNRTVREVGVPLTYQGEWATLLELGDYDKMGY